MNLLPHNARAVREILEAFDNGMQGVLYTSGVGTGKSFVFLGVLAAMREKKPEAKALYVIPKYAIKENIETYDDFTGQQGNVRFATYNSFKNNEKAMKLLNDVDLVLIDECHHVGSDLYGKCLMRCLSKAGTKYLGITATPERKNGKDSVSCFFDASVEGISNFEAIRQNLMPEIIYRVCTPENSINKTQVTLDKAGKRRKKTRNEVRQRLVYDNADTLLAPVLKKFPRDKWICFFASQKDLYAYKPLVERMFPAYKVLILYASLNNLSEVMKEIQENEKVVVLSINILLEGVHLSHIDGIVLFRNVTSLSAFQQMIGRVCAIGKEIEPVVLDCSSSARKLMAMLLSEDNKGKGTGGHGGASSKPVVKIGLGAEEEYDINELFQFAFEGTDMERNMTAQKIDSEYMSRGGTKYTTYEDLKKSKDYSKFSAICWVNGMTPESAYKRMQKMAMTA